MKKVFLVGVTACIVGLLGSAVLAQGHSVLQSLSTKIVVDDSADVKDNASVNNAGSIEDEKNIADASEGNSDLILADMDFENVSVEAIASESNTEYKIALDVVNHHNKVLAGMVYAVQLLEISTEGTKNKIIYEKVYSNDPLTVAPESTLRKEFIFKVPSNISGKFRIKLVGRTSDGLPLENYLTKTTLELTGQELERLLVLSNCYVNLPEQQIDYKVTEGVDITPEEKIKISCTLSNPGDRAIKYSPQVTTYKNSVYGDVIDKSVGVSDEILGGKNRELLVDIKNPGEAGFYDSKLVLIDDQQRPLSNQIKVHYVIQGESGSIGVVRFDKSQYSEGEKMNLKMDVAGRADSFPGSRATKNTEEVNRDKTVLPMQIKIKLTSNNTACVDEISQEVPGEGAELEFTADILRDCQNPIAEIVLSDLDNKILDSKKIRLKQSADSLLKTSRKDFGQKEVDYKVDKKWYYLGALLGIIIMSILFWNIFRKKRSLNILLLGMMMGGLFLFGENANAGTLSYCGQDNTWVAKCYYDISPREVEVGDEMVVEASMTWAACHNQPIICQSEWKPRVNSPYEFLINEQENIVNYCNCEKRQGNDYCERRLDPRNTSPKGTKLHKGASGSCTPGAHDIGYKKRNGSTCDADSMCNHNMYIEKTDNDLQGDAIHRQTAVGSYVAKFHFYWYHSDHAKIDKTYSVPYTVISLAECGSAGTETSPGKVSNTKPTSNLCLKGTESTVSTSINTANGREEWNWTCSNNGTTKNCYAHQSDSAISPACGTADGKDYSTLEVNNSNLCKVGDDPVTAFIHEPTMTPTIDGRWTWKCQRNGRITDEECVAYKKGECNTSKPSGGYAEHQDACTLGSFNYEEINDDKVSWKCGKGHNQDGYGQVSCSGSDGCTITKYDYICSPGDVNCKDKCGESVQRLKLAFRKDISCFSKDPVVGIDKEEYRDKTNNECSNEIVQCPPCAVNDKDSGDSINETN